jgi:hypothetical protein
MAAKVEPGRIEYTVFEPATLGRILDVLLRIEAQFSLMARCADRWDNDGMPMTRTCEAADPATEPSKPDNSRGPNSSGSLSDIPGQ